MDYSYLSVSSGSGDAAVMHITADRDIDATTIVVDSVANVPTKFIGTYGTLLPSTFIDPTTKRDFRGHLSGGDIIIDSFEDGSVDNGNVEGQVVVIKPNTSWANDIVNLARVSHNDDGTIKTSVLGALYPVGSIYSSTVPTNPHDLFGFGTWVAFGAGKVLVGKASSGTFQTAGNTGGAETVALSEAEMPVHSHGVNDPSHTHGVNAGGGYGAGPGNGGLFRVDANSPAVAWSNGVARPALTGITLQNAGSGTAHNNLPPYVVVYMWNRTA